MFAGRRISLPSIQAIAIVVVLGFVAGIGVGWGSSLVAERLTAAEPTLSPTPSPTPTIDEDVAVPPMEPITRERDAGDALAGLTSLQISTDSPRSYTVVTSDAAPTGSAASVRSVRVEYEDGVPMDGEALGQFVLNTLNDPRGWGARGRYEFVPTEGAADLRIVITSPYTAAARCVEPHTPARTGAVSSTQEPTETPDETAEGVVEGASPEHSMSPQEESCAERGVVMVSQYDWVVGLPTYGDDRTAARQYLINHLVGHILGEPDGECASGVAQIMADQSQLPDECEPNAWPWPDEPVDQPGPSTSPTARGDEDE